ncbi:uncharacterized protein LOC122077768 [Macadamia integrifolia]|uniref:uncharacterized protein LOC122077768 n=1 Tax=Macadamia integrifolia TaxID=60698 RepID=UPI001C4E8570|nr:uncharacterized protein LOC122077768 [Macadamia integrifolia]
MAKGAAFYVLVLALAIVFVMDFAYSDMRMAMENVQDKASEAVGNAKETATDAITTKEQEAKDVLKATGDGADNMKDKTWNFFGGVFSGKDESQGPSPSAAPTAA